MRFLPVTTAPLRTARAQPLRETEREENEFLRLQYQVAEELRRTESATEAVTAVLRSIGEALGSQPWSVALYWRFDASDGKLHCTQEWHAASAEAVEFASMNKGLAVSPKAGMPGRVWVTGEPVWVADIAEDAQSPRATAAALAGLHGAGGFPVRVGQKLAGVIELFSPERRSPDADVERALAGATSQLGQFLQKQATEDRLRWADEELRATQLQLVQASKLESVGTLAAGVAHEVKNPLQTIVMGLDYLSNQPFSKDQQADIVLGEMRNAVKRANAIIRELLHFSSATEFDLKEGNLNTVIERALWLINGEVTATHTVIELALSANLPRVRLDSDRLEQVFVNLFINALQAMSQGGTLSVKTRARVVGENHGICEPLLHQWKAGDKVVIAEVKDTGPGIAESDLPRVFDPFFTTKGVGTGTGLGLAVVKKIIELHGGAIRVRNHAGGGVLATVVLKALGGRMT
jgi:two-component system, cell cycle sensor histidine kinase and response regulator CckA